MDFDRAAIHTVAQISLFYTNCMKGAFVFQIQDLEEHSREDLDCLKKYQFPLRVCLYAVVHFYMLVHLVSSVLFNNSQVQFSHPFSYLDRSLPPLEFRVAVQQQ